MLKSGWGYVKLTGMVGGDRGDCWSTDQRPGQSPRDNLAAPCTSGTLAPDGLPNRRAVNLGQRGRDPLKAAVKVAELDAR